jgi:hypothetical protein
MKHSVQFFCRVGVRSLLVAVGVLSVLLSMSTWSVAAELRILDSAGLVRAVRVVKDGGKAVLTLQRNGVPAAAQGECVATNVDGLSAEQRVAISAKGECVFNGLSSGSWQIAVPSEVTWRVRIYE